MQPETGLKDKILNLKIRNPLALAAAFIGAASLFFPWWSITVGDSPIHLYPYYIDVVREPLGFTGAPDETTRMMIFTSIIILMIVLILIGSFKKGMLGRIFTGAGSLGFLGVLYLFKGAVEDHIEMANETQMYVAEGAPGEVYIAAEGSFSYLGTTIVTGYDLGLDLALVCAVIGIIAILIHDMFVIKFR